MAFKKTFFFTSLILTVIFSIQPSFAMNNEEFGWSIPNVLTHASKRLSQAANLMDEVKGINPPELPLSIQQSQTPFFEGLKDDDALCIFSQLCKRVQAIEELRSVALTCRKGYQLTQASCLWELLRNTYFGHLPEEYMVTLVKGKKEQGFPLARTLLQQFLNHQLEEIAQLKKIFSEGYSVQRLRGDPGEAPPAEQLDHDFKVNYIEILRKNAESNINKKRSRIYFSKERMLDSINIEIIKSLAPIAAKVGIVERRINNSLQVCRRAEINLRGALTRLPSEGVAFLIQQNQLHNKDEVHIQLQCNHLRTLPDNLFSIRLIYLDVRNNYLPYIPCSIKRAKSIKKLLIGNFAPLENTRLAKTSLLGRRTTGNSFESFPLAFLKLTHLEELGFDSVGLKEFSENEVYKALPKLSSINLDHNYLTVIPQSNFEGCTIKVRCIGNPIGLLSSNEDIWDYRLQSFSSAPLTRAIASPLTPVVLFVVYCCLFKEKVLFIAKHYLF